MEICINMDAVTEQKFDMNLDKKKCPVCNGTLVIKSFDMNGITYECAHCGEMSTYTFKNADEAKFYIENTKAKLFGKLRKGFIDWQVTDWEHLRQEFSNFIENAHLESDLQLKMAVIACVTKGFNTMDADQYQQSKVDFKVVDRMYKQRLKALRAEMKQKHPVLSNSMEDYKVSRAKYVELRNQYLQTKMMYKIMWSVVKNFFK